MDKSLECIREKSNLDGSEGYHGLSSWTFDTIRDLFGFA